MLLGVCFIMVYFLRGSTFKGVFFVEAQLFSEVNFQEINCPVRLNMEFLGLG